jgi:hypothetical protein
MVSELCNCLKVPSTLLSGSLVAALVPWKLTVDQYKEHEWQKKYSPLDVKFGQIESKLADKLGIRELTTSPLYAQGLRLHHFSIADYEFFNWSSRPYCIWHVPADGSAKHPGFETKSLIAILDAWKAQDVGYKVDVRAVFVHVGALKTLHRLQAVALRRRSQPGLRFYSYGTHPTVPPTRWGLREIYPLGWLSFI